MIQGVAKVTYHLLVDMACLMSIKLTNTGLGKGSARKEMALPLFKNALDKLLDGRLGHCSNDYCGGDSDINADRRGKMACLTLNLTAQVMIEQHVPPRTLPFGLTRSSTLVQSPSFVKDCCNFQYYKDFLVLVKDEDGRPVVHSKGNAVIDGITSQLFGHDIHEQVVIGCQVNRQSQGVATCIHISEQI